MVNPIKHFTLVNYDSRVIIYERKMFIRLATGFLKQEICLSLQQLIPIRSVDDVTAFVGN